MTLIKIYSFVKVFLFYYTSDQQQQVTFLLHKPDNDKEFVLFEKLCDWNGQYIHILFLQIPNLLTSSELSQIHFYKLQYIMILQCLFYFLISDSMGLVLYLKYTCFLKLKQVI